MRRRGLCTYSFRSDVDDASTEQKTRVFAIAEYSVSVNKSPFLDKHHLYTCTYFSGAKSPYII